MNNMTNILSAVMVVLKLIAIVLSLYAQSTPDPRDNEATEYLNLALNAVNKLLRRDETEPGTEPEPEPDFEVPDDIEDVPF